MERTETSALSMIRSSEKKYLIEVVYEDSFEERPEHYEGCKKSIDIQADEFLRAWHIHKMVDRKIKCKAVIRKFEWCH